MLWQKAIGAASGAVKQIDFISQATAFFTGNSGNVTVTTPTHQTGDLFVAFYFSNSNNTNAAVPSGWTENLRDATATNTVRVFSKTATSSEPASVSFAVTTAATSRNSVAWLVYRGDNLSLQLGSLTRALSNTITAASISGATQGKLLAAFMYEGISQAISTPPSGMTQRSGQITAGAHQYIYDEDWSGGTTGDRTASYTGTTVDTAGIQVLIY